MSRPPSVKDALSLREGKRARGAMSCAECRRLKLKCDKTVPCSSCKRRGCAEICPNGSLITGQGTRFVLADTDKLHRKIAMMSDRIRQLEDGLAMLQATVSPETHPLLQRDLLQIKSSIELHAAVDEESKIETQEEPVEYQYIDAFGTLAVRDDGVETFYGRSAGSESLLIGQASGSLEGQLEAHDPSSGGPRWPETLPSVIGRLSQRFPIWSDAPDGITLDYFVDNFLPPWPTARRLSDLYLAQAPWFFGAVTERQLFEEILPTWYAEATDLGPPPQPKAQYSRDERIKSAHDLALLFVIFCLGAVTDMTYPAAPDNAQAEHYYQLTRATLTLEPVLDRPPAVATVQTLSLMAIYQGMSSGENSIESAWSFMALASKLSQSIGLHRDAARFKLPPVEVQKRRALFWELFVTDCWLNLATGRLPTFPLQLVDCELPTDYDQTMSHDGKVEPSFPAWKALFGRDCIAALVQDTLTPSPPKYNKILDLDRRIRDMGLPAYAEGSHPTDVGLAEMMRHFMPMNYINFTLLYVHRCFFASALQTHPHDPVKSAYGPSFLAGYRTASELLDSLRTQFVLFPAEIARFWVLWTHSFSALVMLASIVTHAPTLKIAPAALTQLRKAADVFEQAALHGGRAVKFLPIVRRLLQKADQVYEEEHRDVSSSRSNDIFTLTKEGREKDELSLFSGQTHTLSIKTHVPAGLSLSRNASPLESSGSDATRASSHDQSQSPPPRTFSNVHPHLVHQYYAFDAHLEGQAHGPFIAHNESFSRTLSEGEVQHYPPQSGMPQRVNSQQQPYPGSMYIPDPPAHKYAEDMELQSDPYRRAPPVYDSHWVSHPAVYPTDHPAAPELTHQEASHGQPPGASNLQDSWNTFMYEVAPFR